MSKGDLKHAKMSEIWGSGYQGLPRRWASCAAVTIAAIHGTLTGKCHQPVDLGPCRSRCDPQVKGGGIDCCSAVSCCHFTYLTLLLPHAFLGESYSSPQGFRLLVHGCSFCVMP